MRKSFIYGTVPYTPCHERHTYKQRSCPDCASCWTLPNCPVSHASPSASALPVILSSLSLPRHSPARDIDLLRGKSCGSRTLKRPASFSCLRMLTHPRVTRASPASSSRKVPAHTYIQYILVEYIQLLQYRLYILGCAR